jgi:uncharacterized protein (DUF2252 family)
MTSFRPPRRPDTRQAVLGARQKLKMARSAHAYVRGSTSRFYEWLESEGARSLPDGPPVWICGDCHTGNLGPVSDARGRVAIQIRDFDQAVTGNPAHDLIRLGLSLATAARGSDLPGVTTADIIEDMVDAYEKALASTSSDSHRDRRRPESVKLALRASSSRSWKHLLRERLDDTMPTIPLGARFWPLTHEERRAVDELFTGEPIRRLVTSLRCRDDDARVEVVDAAYWMKGCSSLGRLRYAVLLRVGHGRTGDGSLCLMDIKEAVRSCAPRAPGARVFRDHGERVVLAAQALAPYLGERMRSGHLVGRPIFLRELLPQDLKLEIEHLSRKEATLVGRFLATVVGRAHARQLDRPTRTRWAAELRRHRPKTLDAPSWLWSSVVDLVATHETAYLDHCRRYALGTERTHARRT